MQAQSTISKQKEIPTHPFLSKDWGIMLLFAAIAVALRFFSFFPSVINHDESTYLIIADAIRHGQLYFVEIIDTKPIGVFLLLAGFQSVIGKSIFGFRVITALWIAGTAYGIFRVQLSLGGERRVGFVAGVMYILILSIFTFYGLSPNTEVFFAPFTIWALWLVLNRQHWWQDAASGLLLGLGFMIKYVVVFDAFAFGVFLLWMTKGNWQQLAKVLQRGIVMLSFFLLPFGLTYVYYWQAGFADEFLFYTFEVTSRYPIDKTFLRSTIYVLDFFGRFFPLTLMAGYCWFDRSVSISKLKTLALIWGLSVITAITLPGKLFGHYWIQFMPILSIVAAEFFNSRRKRPQFITKISLRWRYGWLCALVIVLTLIQKHDNFDEVDQIALVAEDLKNRLEESDQIYTGNYHQILYYLLNLQSPTPYVHRSLLWDAHHVAALQIDLQKETNNILSTAPRFIILGQTTPDNLLADSIYLHYQKVADYGGGIELYEQKNKKK